MLAFHPDGSDRTVARICLHRVVEGHQFLLDRLDQLPVRTARKIGPADGTGEERIAHEKHLIEKETNAAGGVTGGVDHAALVLSHLHRVSL